MALTAAEFVQNDGTDPTTCGRAPDLISGLRGVILQRFTTINVIRYHDFDFDLTFKIGVAMANENTSVFMFQTS